MAFATSITSTNELTIHSFSCVYRISNDVIANSSQECAMKHAAQNNMYRPANIPLYVGTTLEELDGIETVADCNPFQRHGIIRFRKSSIRLEKTDRDCRTTATKRIMGGRTRNEKVRVYVVQT